jgi:hypothetical protein
MSSNSWRIVEEEVGKKEAPSDGEAAATASMMLLYCSIDELFSCGLLLSVTINIIDQFDGTLTRTLGLSSVHMIARETHVNKIKGNCMCLHIISKTEARSRHTVG